MTTLEMEIQTLKERVERLEERLEAIQGEEPDVPVLTPGEPVTRAQLRAWLKAKGLIVDLPPEVRAYGEAWRSLSDEEKQRVRWELDHLPPGPMASDIVIQNRR